MTGCGEHPEGDSYIACLHVLAGAPCTHFVRATRTGDALVDAGEALCRPCKRRLDQERLPPSAARVVCGLCLSQVLRPSTLLPLLH